MANAVKKVPERTCVGCGQKKEKRDLIRIVHEPDGTFSVDPTGRKNGRGAYICKNLECLEKAQKKKTFDRAFKEAVPEEAFEKLKEELGNLDR